MKTFRTLLVVVLSLALAGTAWALQGQGQGAGKSKKAEVPAASDEKAKPEKPDKPDKPGHGPAFGKDDADKIRIWFHDNQNGLPPGLAKRDQLPPGLQKHLVKNGTLPPGLQKKLYPLPRALEIKLPRVPRGYRRYVIGPHVVLIERRTYRIVDIIPDVIIVRS